MPLSVHRIRVSSSPQSHADAHAFVGQIRSFHEIKDALGAHLEITFFNRDAATYVFSSGSSDSLAKWSLQESALYDWL